MNEVNGIISSPYIPVNPDFFGFPVSPLPKTLDKFGVLCSPLGRRATVDTIFFRCPIDCYDGISESFPISRNIEVKIYKYFKTWFIEVRVYSLTRFENGRSSSLIRDYHDVLLSLNAFVNLKLEERNKPLSFDAFDAEIIRLDCFVDLRFKNKSEMRQFYQNAVQAIIPALPFTTDYETTHYWHDSDGLDNSTEYLRIYDKEVWERLKKSKELDRNKLRVESSLQNKLNLKPLNDFLDRIEQPETSYAVKIVSNDSRVKNIYRIYENEFKANAFTLLNQTAIDELFGFVSNDFLTT